MGFFGMRRGHRIYSRTGIYVINLCFWRYFHGLPIYAEYVFLDATDMDLPDQHVKGRNPPTDLG